MNTTQAAARLILKTGKIESLNRFHPWVFSGAIKRIEGDPVDGDLVELFDNHDRFLALGQYGTGSIAARIIAWEPYIIDHEFWKNKFETAWSYRMQLNLLNSDNNVFRLIHGEADGMPGLIVDFYNGVAVMEFHAAGMERISNDLAKALAEATDGNIKTIVGKSKANAGNNATLLFGKAPQMPYEIIENSKKFNVNWDDGQKTGFFIDQRENRQMLGHYSKNRNVLNMFCYTGGFSVYALSGGATKVVSVDSSSKAIELCRQNLELNGFSTDKNKCIESDALDYLKAMPKNEYDIIVLDPPAYAKRVDTRHNAIQGYKRLNAEALAKIKSGGFLFTYSCSQVVDRNHFNGAVTAAAIAAERKVRVVAQLSQAPCHGHTIFHPEGFYLKGLTLYVE
ncbi:MAG: RlmI/RlmK family 23S rRNA methyltransferase [Bacteroidetes bacterium HGW-Bacteroidetes-6]|jgi:23S rRNA (cytosine1962-C5)-methyltransferase|nr:MAG: RlmI/RlmK family 23S rRNA methyltransferase [Bacteroidetes bacterium HGW-Bacteroidetes-6]